MRYILLLIILVITFGVQAQSTSEKVTSKSANLSEIEKSNLLFKDLPYNSWKRAVERNRSNANAWLDYYVWTERDKNMTLTQKKTALGNTFLASEGYISGSWQYNLIQFLQSNKTDSVAIHTATELAENKADILPYLIQYNILKGNIDELSKTTFALNKLKPLSNELYEYHYNTLMSAGKNAVIYARGIQDLVPLAIIQQQFHVRQDIILKYYNGTLPKIENSYLCLSIGKEIMEEYPDAAFTGLLIKLDSTDAFKELENNYNFLFDLKILDSESYTSDYTIQLYKNYLPGFILLYRYYHTNNDKRAIQLKKIIIKIASKAGIEKNIHQLIDR